MKNFLLNPGSDDHARCSVFEDCTVTDTSPLRIRRDGDAEELPFTPDTLIAPGDLDVDDRVRVEIANGRIIIHGKRH